MGSGMKRLAALRRLVLGLVALALVLAVVGVVLPKWKQARATAEYVDQCRTTAAASAARNRTVTGNGPLRITVLGDSYAQGYLLRDPTQSWPSRLAAPLDARVTVRSLGGTGFTAAPCDPADAFFLRAPAVAATRPDLVIVEGGLNDTLVTTPQLVAGLRQTLTELGPVRVVVVGPADAPHWHRAAAHVDQVLRDTAQAAGVQYVSPYNWPLSFARDGMHLTPASQRMFGDRVAAAIAE